MSRIKRHYWTETDEANLAEAVRILSECEMPRGSLFWSAVVGRLAPDIVVSPRAAESRWYEMRRAKRVIATPEEADAWDRVSQKVVEYELDTMEWIVDTLQTLKNSVDQLVKEWSGD